jgi:nucleoside-diphosphate-sugar epimerase
MAPTFLIIGATGTQGGSVVQALVSSPSLPPSANILALTRNTTSAKAKALAALDSRVHLLNGDPANPSQIFESAKAFNTQIDSVFLVTVHGPPGSEEGQAHGIIDASLAHGVKHFVFTSADRGGDVVSETNPTPVAHIATKYRIELYLKEKCAATSMKWTILRPTTFMDNLTPGLEGKAFAAMWNQVGSKPIQLVAATDIGAFAAKAFLSPEKYAGRCIGIAGDELNFKDALKVFKETMGQDMPTTFCAVGSMVKIALPDIGAMFRWFEKGGYAVDIKAAREEYPELQDFRTWLLKNSQFEVKK